jgi:nucleoside-diphosphate-sugar epimerase
MTTLITGATGFIGGRMVNALLERGDQVRALVRNPGKATELGSRGVELVAGDVEDSASLNRAVEGVDRVYHCAALVGDWLSKADIQRVNVEGTRSLLQACAGAHVQRLVYLSSLAVLGTMHHQGTDESAPYRYTGDLYSDSKIDSEQIVQEFARRGDVETVILRPGFVYGPGDHQFLPRLLDGLASGQFIYVGDGAKLLNIVYVDDVAQAALLAYGNPAADGQAYNLTDGTKTSLAEFVEFICDYLHIPPPKRHIPAPVAWGACYALELAARLRRAKEPPRLNRGRMKFLYYNQYYSIEKARRELGYSARFSYREGLPPTLDWFRHAGLLPQQLMAASASAG